VEGAGERGWSYAERGCSCASETELILTYVCMCVANVLLVCC
jgi:hypothetical protein